MAWRRDLPDGGWGPVALEPFESTDDRELARGRIGLRATE
jgi:hypothetical protein